MGYPTPENRERWCDVRPGPTPVGPAGASSARDVQPTPTDTNEED